MPVVDVRLLQSARDRRFDEVDAPALDACDAIAKPAQAVTAHNSARIHARRTCENANCFMIGTSAVATSLKRSLLLHATDVPCANPADEPGGCFLTSHPVMFARCVRRKLLGFRALFWVKLAPDLVSEVCGRCKFSGKTVAPVCVQVLEANMCGDCVILVKVTTWSNGFGIQFVWYEL